MTNGQRLRAEALRLLKGRLDWMIEQARLDFDSEHDDVDWPEVIAAEVTHLVERGPASYIEYVQQLDEAAVRVQLDRELDRILTDSENPS